MCMVPLAYRSFSNNIMTSATACMIPLRDQLVCSMKDLKVQRCLLTISDLTFKKALEEAEIAEIN